MVAVNVTPFSDRFRITDEIKAIGIRNGDIFFRQTDTKGAFGIPFGYLVAKMTHSNFSHASVARVEGDEVYLLEVNDRGVVKERLIDWLDYCVGEGVQICRLINQPSDFDALVTAEIDRFFAEDFTYDFTYSLVPKQYYCTRSVCEIYQKAGVILMEPKTVKESVDSWQYMIFYPINKLIMVVSGKGFDTAQKFYFVGNKTQGMLASPLIHTLYLNTGTLTMNTGW